MRRGRISKVLAAAAVLALSLAACTGTTPDPIATTQTTTADVGGNVTVLESAPFSSFNATSVTGSTLINTRIGAATHSGFYSVDDELKISSNEKFGKIEKVKDNPLTIKYTIAGGVQWSDGAPVTADDLFLQWAAASGYFDDATLGASFAVTKGTAYFHAAGDNKGLKQTGLPVIGDNRTSPPSPSQPTQPCARWLIFGTRASTSAACPTLHSHCPTVRSWSRTSQQGRIWSSLRILTTPGARCPNSTRSPCITRQIRTSKWLH